MSSLSTASKSLLRVSRLLADWPRHDNTLVPRTAALTVLIVYVALATAAYRSTLDPPQLSMRIGLCEAGPCVTWVMPASVSWDDGARPGMAVRSVDERPATELGEADLPLAPVSNAELVTPAGDVFRVEATVTPISQGPMRFSLWLVGTSFALLGAAVLLRRPDLSTAKVFAAFAGTTALALVVAPSAGGPAPEWALVVQALSSIGVGAAFVALTVALMEDSARGQRSRFLPLVVGLGVVIAGAYGASVVVEPRLYEVVRPVLILYVSACVIGSIWLLAVRSARGPRLQTRQQARIVLWGTALSVLPFVLLTLIPEATGLGTLVPVHLSSLGLGLMPAFFAYAILQHQLMGIRRLVHRGMVYGLATLGLFSLIAIGLAVAAPLTGTAGEGIYSSLTLAAFLIGGILLYYPMRRATRWVVDRLVYGEVVDPETFLGTLEENLVGSMSTVEVATGITGRFAQALRLESALMFLGPDPHNSQLVAAMGDRARSVVNDKLPHPAATYRGGPARPYRIAMGVRLLSPYYAPGLRPVPGSHSPRPEARGRSDYRG